MTFLQRFHQYWSWFGMRWQVIIPAIFIIAAIVWFFVVYRKDRFRFLPAWAIARVTVQDSIGRLEVISLLLIGMLLIGVFGLTILYPPMTDQMLQVPTIQKEFAEMTGDTGMEVPDVDEKAFLCVLMGKAAMLFGDAFVALIGFILAMFLIPNEISRGVILSILPKPITRSEYLFGKFLGTWILVTGCFLVLAIELYLIQGTWFWIHSAAAHNISMFDWKGHYPVNWPLLKVMVFFPFKYATLILLIMMLSLRMPEAPAGIVGLFFYMAGHLSAYIYDQSRQMGEAGNRFFEIALKYAYWVVPHLADSWVTLLDHYSATLDSWDERWGWIWQITVYNALLYWLLIWLFRRRSL
jgi:ABC-type transport system involved in multi-copper enzyme maturation permease subunit